MKTETNSAITLSATSAASKSETVSSSSLTSFGSMKVNAGTAGNVRPVLLDGSKTYTVADVLDIAEISTEGYDIRVNGQPSTGTSPVSDGQTILLLAPVVGNLRNNATGDSASTETKKDDVIVESIKVNVGTAGNVRTITLDAGNSKVWTVGEVLRQAEISPSGYDIRVNGKPSDGSSAVTDNQTILLLAPVVGN